MNDKSRFVALDSLRGLCASFVVFFHFNGDAFIHNLTITQHAFLFVDFFFVLSGFVIAASYGEKLRSGYSISKFFALRLGRLYPLHIFMMALYSIVLLIKIFATDKQGTSFYDFFSSLFLLQSLTYYPENQESFWNAPSWSISAELWTYLFYSIIWRFFPFKWLKLIFPIIAVTALVLYFGSDRAINVCYSYISLIRCIFGFSFGILSYSIWSSVKKHLLNRQMMTIIELLVGMISIQLVLAADANWLSLLCPLGFALLIVIYANEAGIVSQFLAIKPFAFIGMLSYSIYMTHEFVLARLINFVSAIGHFISLPVRIEPTTGFGFINAEGHHIYSDIAMIIFYTIVIAFSYFTYQLIELPFREWSRRVISREKTAADAPQRQTGES